MLEDLSGLLIDVLTIEFGANKMNLIFISDCKQALTHRGTPLNRVNDPVRKAILPHDLA